MSKVMVTESYLDDIADAIREKTGTQDTYTPAEMADAIESISGGGITPTGTISITENGTVDVTQYASADVNVPSVTPTGTINITQNGTTDVTNYASANVNVPNPSTGTKQISITQNGTTTEDVTNYASAEISVSVSGFDDPYDFSGGNILAITSHGTEYIDTDYYPNMSGYFCTKLADSDSLNYEGYWSAAGSSNARLGIQRNGSSLQIQLGVSSTVNISYPGYSTGSIVYPFFSTIGIATQTASMPLIFYRNYYNGSIENRIATYTFYGLNMLNSNFEYVAKFRPWLDNGEACIKELISGSIYKNAGTGAFDYIDLEGVSHSA